MFIKKIAGLAASIAALTIASSAFAAADGAYVGGQLGWGDIHQSAKNTSNSVQTYHLNSFSSSSKDTGLAGRLFAGYQFNENWAAELGWSKFHNSTAHASGTGVGSKSLATLSANGKSDIKTDAFDLVGKAILPLPNNFSVYAKAGVAYLIERAHTTSNATEGFQYRNFSYSSQYPTVSTNKTERKLLPTYGAGVAYDISQNVVADLSWNRIQKVGSTHLNSTDLVSFGLAYHFG